MSSPEKWSDMALTPAESPFSAGEKGDRVMFKFIKRAGVVAALAVGTMALAPAAEARDRYYDRRGDTTGAAVAGGIIGLALGAAIASSGRDRYYDDGYYYGRPRVYYRAYPRYYRPYPRGYYYDRYPRRDYRYYDRGWRDYRRGGW
jgi:hypothetical protein